MGRIGLVSGILLLGNLPALVAGRFGGVDLDHDVAPLEVEQESTGRQLQKTVDHVAREGVVRALVIVPLARDESPISDEEDFWRHMNSVYEEIEAFYEENSGGLFSIKFDVVNDFIRPSDYSVSDCQSASNCPKLSTGSSWVKEADREGKLPRDLDEYDRYVFSYPRGCDCLPLGSAAILGSSVAIGADPFTASIHLIVAHELGHTNGAGHAGFKLDKYGNPYSVMGNRGAWPAQHFSIAGKVAFNWVKVESQIVTMARDGHLECPPIDGGSCSSTRQDFTLYASDFGSYDDDKLYGARIFTSIPGKHLWLEYRNKYEDLNEVEGLIMVLSKESHPLETDPDFEYASTYGPTTLINGRPGTAEEGSQLKAGDSFVFDPDGTGAQITVLSRSADKRSVRVSVEFIALTNTENPPSTSVLADELPCSSTVRLAISKPNEDLAIVRVDVPQPSELTLRALGCRIGEEHGIELANMYLYSAYPTHLVENPDLDPALGAVASLQVQCLGRSQDLSFVAENGVLPMGKDYYMLLADAGKTDLLGSIWIQSECKPTGSCRLNHYRSGGECIRCPAGKVADENAESINDCYDFVAEFDLRSASDSEFNGRYILSPGASSDAHFWTRIGPGPKIDLRLYGETWRLVKDDGESLDLRSDRSSKKHPLGAGLTFTSTKATFRLDPDLRTVLEEGEPYFNSRSLSQPASAQNTELAHDASAARSLATSTLTLTLAWVLLVALLQA